MSLDEAIKRLSPRPRGTPPTRALLTADEASKVIGMPVWQVTNLTPVKVGKRAYRYPCKLLGIYHPPAKDSTVPELADRWGVSAGLVRRMIDSKTLKLRAGRRPATVLAASIRSKEKSRG